MIDHIINGLNVFVHFKFHDNTKELLKCCFRDISEVDTLNVCLETIYNHERIDTKINCLVSLKIRIMIFIIIVGLFHMYILSFVQLLVNNGTLVYLELCWTGRCYPFS